MRLSEEKYEDIFNFIIITISVTLVFRQLSTILIIGFTLFNIFFYRNLKFEYKNLALLLIITSPLLLDIIFFWNNESLIAGLKSAEKRVSLLIFPIFILGFSKKINFLRLLKFYVVITTIILIILFLRYLIMYPDNVQKYLNNIHLWEMGYHFSSSFGMHAPALNMHVSFFSVSAFFLIFTKSKSKFRILLKTICFFLSLFFLLIINTRVALVTSILGYVVIILYQFKSKRFTTRKLVRISILVSFLIVLSISLFARAFPYIIHKYGEGSFSNMEMIGRLDELENPEKQVYNKLVTRLSIWKSAYELSQHKIWAGYGASDGKKELINYYKKTDQKFLARNKFPVHNQYLDFLLKFGLLGLFVVLVYIITIGWLGFQLKNPIIISYFLIFFICNLTDDFLIRYDGITFSGLWFSIFANQYKSKLDKI